jgi:hypothetical protein
MWNLKSTYFMKRVNNIIFTLKGVIEKNITGDKLKPPTLQWVNTINLILKYQI